MAAEKRKQTEHPTASDDIKSVPMDRMMSQMMKMCCTGEGKFFDCVSKMKEMMNTQPPLNHREETAESEEKKK